MKMLKWKFTAFRNAYQFGLQLTGEYKCVSKLTNGIRQGSSLTEKREKREEKMRKWSVFRDIGGFNNSQATRYPCEGHSWLDYLNQ